jgi:hypothetical protein
MAADPWAVFKDAPKDDPWAQFSDARAPQAPQEPSMMDRLRTNPVIGAPLQTLLRVGQGMTELGASLPQPGELIDPEIGRYRRDLQKRVLSANQAQNQEYLAARMRVANASTDPRMTLALQGTGGDMGNLLNPMGVAGGNIANPVARGIVGASAFALSQPVADPEADFWLEKAKQQAVAVPVGAVMGAIAAPGRAKPPTAKELKGQITAAYTTAREEGATFPKQQLANALDDIESSAAKGDMTYRESLHPKTATAFAQIRSELEKSPDQISLGDVEIARRIALTTLESQQKSDRAVGHHLIDKLDDFADQVSQGNPLFKQARDLYARSAKSATVERLIERAKNATGANYTQAGYETALRQQFRALANNENAMRRFNPEERAAILKVVRGGPVENALRIVGKLAVRGPISAAPAVAGGMYTENPLVGAGIAGLGEVGRFGATQLGLRNVRLADELMRRGSAPQPSFPGPAPNVPVGTLPSALLIEALMRPQRAY